LGFIAFQLHPTKDATEHMRCLGRDLCAIRQHRINLMKPSRWSPSEQTGDRDVFQIQGDVTATG
ncbi:hypothetical protein AMECASPLE_010388, partial [Ameca splendens]